MIGLLRIPSFMQSDLHVLKSSEYTLTTCTTYLLALRQWCPHTTVDNQVSSICVVVVILGICWCRSITECPYSRLHCSSSCFHSSPDHLNIASTLCCRGIQDLVPYFPFKTVNFAVRQRVWSLENATKKKYYFCNQKTWSCYKKCWRVPCTWNRARFACTITC